jgi:predicted PurR-regulated permease PerM
MALRDGRLGLGRVHARLLISRGGTTPIVVTLLGILGGVIAFGFLGLFLGPTLLAVGYSLVSEWTARHPAAERQTQA